MGIPGERRNSPSSVIFFKSEVWPVGQD
jgi:hypothetical protein